MCGRYILLQQIQELQQRFGAEPGPCDFLPTYNAAPGQRMPVVARSSPARLRAMRWGLVPSWAKDPRIGYRMINARAEGIGDKPSFRAALRRRRCLVPSSGFYEWKPGPAGTKAPYLIRMRSGEPFAFAGLWESWQDPSGGQLETYTIVTTPPNDLMQDIHDRMPVILRREDEAEWTDPEAEDPAQLTRLLVPYPSEHMEAYPVSTEVNSVRNDAPSLIERQPESPAPEGGPDSL